jgi:hypothetical protein
MNEMKKAKLYWSEVIDDERVFTRSNLIERMKENDISELKAYKTSVVKADGFFFCHDIGEWSEQDGLTCGKHNCESYSPRNGKNGRCRFHDTITHEPTDEFIILKVNP